MENKSFWRLVLVLIILAAVFTAIGLIVTPAQAAMGDSTALARKNSELAPAALGNSNGIDKNTDAATRPDCKSLIAEKWQLEEDIIALKIRFWLGIPLGAVAMTLIYFIYRFITSKRNGREPRPPGENKESLSRCVWGTTNCRYSHSDHSQYECKSKTDMPPKFPQ